MRQMTTRRIQSTPLIDLLFIIFFYLQSQTFSSWVWVLRMPVFLCLTSRHDCDIGCSPSWRIATWRTVPQTQGHCKTFSNEGCLLLSNVHTVPGAGQTALTSVWETVGQRNAYHEIRSRCGQLGSLLQCLLPLPCEFLVFLWDEMEANLYYWSFHNLADGSGYLLQHCIYNAFSKALACIATIFFQVFFFFFFFS